MRDLSSPDYLDDIQSSQAATMENCRHCALNCLYQYGYQLITPPLVEYIETLTAGDDKLDLQTFKITDTLSGRTLGIRADQTPQIARIDAAPIHQSTLPRRYCYCGPVLRTQPPQPWLSRECMQLGAELFGFSSPEGDWEILEVTLATLQSMGLDQLRVDIGHVGLFSPMLSSLETEIQEQLMQIIKHRDIESIQSMANASLITTQLSQSLQILATTHGGIEEIEKIRPLLSLESQQKILQDIEFIFAQLPPTHNLRLNLSELGSHGYHTGIVFTIIQSQKIVAQGGRYLDINGSDAVGFSVDLKLISEQVSSPAKPTSVAVPLVGGDSSWRDALNQLQEKKIPLYFVPQDSSVSPPYLYKNEKVWEVVWS